MNHKGLNRLIATLFACLISLAIAAIAAIMIPKELIIWNLLFDVLKAIADAVILVVFYQAIKSYFPHKTSLALLSAGLICLIMMPFWAAFKLFVMTGTFNLGASYHTMYFLFFDNLLHKILTEIIGYFSLTLFNAPDVVNQLLIFTFKTGADVINYLIIPILPLILIVNDFLRGNEEYRFNTEEPQQPEP